MRYGLFIIVFLWLMLHFTEILVNFLVKRKRSTFKEREKWPALNWAIDSINIYCLDLFVIFYKLFNASKFNDVQLTIGHKTTHERLMVLQFLSILERFYLTPRLREIVETARLIRINFLTHLPHISMSTGCANALIQSNSSLSSCRSISTCVLAM